MSNYTIKNFNTKNYIYGIYIIGFFYSLAIAALIYLQKPILIYEWADIVPTLIKTDEYKYLGVYSAFMPPLYPYYLLCFQKIFGGEVSIWLTISILIQSALFYFSIYSLVNLVLKNSPKYLILVCISIILFFPPILFGVVRNSSYALTTSVYIFSFIFSYKFILEKKSLYLHLFLLFSLIGFYLRWDFSAYFVFMSFAIILNSEKKQKVFFYFLPFVFVFICYLPWCYRNYVKIGKFTYNTATAFNISKGNNIKFDLNKMSNAPNYDFKTSSDYIDFKSELERDNHLMEVTKKYILNNPGHFIKTSFGKLVVNATQYFPDSFEVYKIGQDSKAKLYTILYSAFFIIYTIFLIVSIIKSGIMNLLSFKPENYFYQFVAMSFIFHFIINTFAAPPLPRYILFYFPFFTISILSMNLTWLKKDLK